MTIIFRPRLDKKLATHLRVAQRMAGEDLDNPTLVAAFQRYHAAVSPLIQAVHTVNGAASQWTLTVSDIVKALHAQPLVPVGTKLTLRSGGPTNKSYRYPVRGTRVEFTRVRGGWKLDKVERVDVWPGDKAIAKLTTTVSILGREHSIPFQIEKKTS